MAITKTHIAKQIMAGIVILSETECGLNEFQKGGRRNYITKTGVFKKLYEEAGTVSCCVKCLSKAKKQGRV